MTKQRERVGPYVVGRLICTSLTSQVYRGFGPVVNGPPSLTRRVVLKRPVYGSAYAVQILDEGRIGSQLHHPNLIRIEDTLEHGGHHWLISELVPGITLDQALCSWKRQPWGAGPRTVQTIARVLRSVANGLHALHRCWLDGAPADAVHLDIKPSNILLLYGGADVKLFDYSIAQFRGRTFVPEYGTVQGTPPYMSPEQVTAGVLDARSDLFSIGSVLYEMITGEYAFPGSDKMEIMIKIARAESQDELLNKADAISRPLTDILERCWKHRAGARYQSAKQLADALAALTEESSASPPRITP